MNGSIKKLYETFIKQINKKNKYFPLTLYKSAINTEDFHSDIYNKIPIGIPNIEKICNKPFDSAIFNPGKSFLET